MPSSFFLSRPSVSTPKTAKGRRPDMKLSHLTMEAASPEAATPGGLEKCALQLPSLACEAPKAPRMHGERYARPPVPSWNTEAAGSCCAWPGHTGRGDAVRHADKTPRSRSKKRTFPKIYLQPHGHHEGE